MFTEIPPTIFRFFNDSQIPLTLSDPNLPDDPLVLANAAFYKMTGYAAAEVIGHNCRFMQGVDTQKSIRQVIRDDFGLQRDTRVLIRNYRRNREAFDNFLYIFTVLDLYGKPLYRFGSQFEVPMIDKTTSFENHAAELRAGIAKLNLQAVAARQQTINLADIAGMTAKDLLMARLEVMKMKL